MKPALPVGAVRPMAGGYLKVKVGPGYKDWVYQHRHVMESHLGRPLARNEHVHHRDEDKQNNDIANLELVGHGEHVTRHQTGRVREQQKRASILALRELGFTMPRIGQIIGCTPSNITRHIQRANGIYRHSRAALEG